MRKAECGMRNQFIARLSNYWVVAILCVLLVAPLQPATAADQKEAAVQVKTTPFATSTAPCTQSFVPHELPHTTTVSGKVVQMFDSNGSGLAINDLDNDGKLDLVLGNLAGPSTIFWNQGGFQFRKETLPVGNTLAVNIVDVDGDGWQDIVFTHQTTAPTLWRNQIPYRKRTNERSFAPIRLQGVDKLAYTIAWGDLDKDGDLDLVTGSYDLALERMLGDKFRFGTGAGVYYYENTGKGFARNFLARHAQTLAMLLFDANHDGWQDILVGNDFDVPDQLWLHTSNGWQTGQVFTQTTQNTMSFAVGDIANNGRPALFAADMMPYKEDAATMAAWKPVMERMPHMMKPGDPQIMENVLQVQNANGHFENQAVKAGVAATGWTWSAKFGDLDNDGYLDLYVVNGMQALDLFDQLPNNELVEENQAFHNQKGTSFTPMPAWKLNATEGGRGMSMADLDNDGALDIVVNNLMHPAKIFENSLCSGSALEVELFWPNSKNTRALGAQLILHTSQGNFYRDVRSESGYLSGDPARLHFGFPQNTQLLNLEIHWPDGALSKLEKPTVGLLQVTRP